MGETVTLERRKLSRQEALGIFEGALAALGDLRTLEEVRLYMADGLHGHGIVSATSGGEPSKPTERQGEALADRSGEFEADRKRLVGQIELARGLCRGIGRSIGIRYAMVMECYYLLGLSWKQVADAMHVGKATALRMRDVAIGEVVDRGTAYLLELAEEATGE